MACESCKSEFIAMLENRIEKILSIDSSQSTNDGVDYAKATCFHLLELKRKLEGKPVTKMYE